MPLFDIWLKDGELQLDRRIGDHKVRMVAGSVYTVDVKYGDDPNTGNKVPWITGVGGAAYVTSAGLGWRESAFTEPTDLTQISVDRSASWRRGKLKRLQNKMERKIDAEYGKGHYLQTYQDGERMGRGGGLEYVRELYNEIVDKKDAIKEPLSLDPPTPAGVQPFATVFKGETPETLDERTCKCGLLCGTLKQLRSHEKDAHNPRKRKKGHVPGYDAQIPDHVQMHTTVIDSTGKPIGGPGVDTEL